MKSFSITFSFTDRSSNPVESPAEVEASTLPVGLAKATREFWKKQDRKARFDILKSGLKISVTAGEEKAEKEETATA
jgi:hypothetical protein